MMVKIVSLFLVAIAILAMFGRLRLPGGGKIGLKKTAKCPHCGRHKLGKGPCPCRKG
ncbi:hypothetical protein ATO10_15440 [Actibacterium atlanticum]|uniref:Uncharacterized protein n=1 Tax=Actibacterium atlanticum TaxID=1461693 RepID=A0A058ZGS2_9RHOB|nr:hypothetical protein ATO10_15440 [Actibacterium atlanticum]